jgi:hypothetical protein
MVLVLAARTMQHCTTIAIVLGNAPTVAFEQVKQVRRAVVVVNRVDRRSCAFLARLVACFADRGNRKVWESGGGVLGQPSDGSAWVAHDLGATIKVDAASMGQQQAITFAGPGVPCAGA